jgi:hypothetical protein
LNVTAAAAAAVQTVETILWTWMVSI